LTALLIYGVSVVLLALFGAGIPFLFKRKKKGGQAFRFFVTFGSGVLLGAAFLHMIPRAAELTGASVGLWILSGFLFLYLLEYLTFSHSCEEHDCRTHSLGLVAAAGLTLHNFVNGVALGSASQVPVLGFWVFFATAAHKVPEFFSLSSILLSGKRSRNKVFWIVLGVSSMILFGAFFSGLFLGKGSAYLLGVALGFSAGTFIHLAATDLAPEVHGVQQYRWAHLASFLLGVALMGLSAWFEVVTGG